MMKVLKNLFFNNNSSSNNITDKAMSAFNRAYSRRAEEITSLRKYDRGEKVIVPSSIRSLSKSV